MPKADDKVNARVNAMLGQARPPLAVEIKSPADLAELRRRWREVEAAPVVCAQREDGVDNSWNGLDIRTYLRGEQSAGEMSMHSVILPPGTALAPHYHDDIETFLIVLRGRPTLQIGGLIETGARFSVGYAPPRTRVGIANRTDEPVWINLVYKPGGLDRAFAECHAHWQANGDTDPAAYETILARFGVRFNDTALANDTRTNDALPPIEGPIATEGDLEALRAALAARPAVPSLTHTCSDEVDRDGIDPGFRKRVLNGDQSGGSAMMNFVSRIPPAPCHYQPTEEELFFILGGQLKMVCGTAEVVLGEGAFAFAPRNCTHAFAPPAEGIDHKFMTLNSPAGHEHAMAAIRERQRNGLTQPELFELAAVGGMILR